VAPMTGHHLEGDLGSHVNTAAAIGDGDAVEEQPPAVAAFDQADAPVVVELNDGAGVNGHGSHP